MPQAIRVAAFGGGNGTAFLKYLKEMNTEVSSIIPGLDEGGSTGEAYNRFGFSVQSDYINNLVWLSGKRADPAVLKMLEFRFARRYGLGNFRLATLMFSALILENGGDLEKSLRELHHTLDVYPHRVIPTTYTQGIRIKAIYKENPHRSVVGEKDIDLGVYMNSDQDYIEQLGLEGEPEANPEAILAIKNANLILICPGSLHTSSLPGFLVPGIYDAIDNTDVPIVYVVNLTSTFGDTHGLNAKGHLFLVNKYLGKRKVTHCIVNSDMDYPDWVIRKYREEGGDIVKDNFTKDNTQGAKIIRADLYSKEIHEQPENDETPRSAIKHNGEDLSKEILRAYVL